jgi:hypothetical protein
MQTNSISSATQSIDFNMRISEVEVIYYFVTAIGAGIKLLDRRGGYGYFHFQTFLISSWHGIYVIYENTAKRSNQSDYCWT